MSRPEIPLSTVNSASPLREGPGTPLSVPESTQPRIQAESLHRLIRQAVTTERQAIREVAYGLAEMNRTQLYRELGYARLTEYGEGAFGYSRSKTFQLARIGGKLPRLPILDQALLNGDLGWTKVRTVADIATAKTEEKWVEMALLVTSRELEDMAFRARVGDLPSRPEDDIEPMQYVWVKARMEALHYELLMRALNKIRHELGDPDLSTSQLLLLLAERELERVEADKSEESVEVPVEEPAEAAVQEPAEQPAETPPGRDRLVLQLPGRGEALPQVPHGVDGNARRPHRDRARDPADDRVRRRRDLRGRELWYTGPQAQRHPPCHSPCRPGPRRRPLPGPGLSPRPLDRSAPHREALRGRIARSVEPHHRLYHSPRAASPRRPACPARGRRQPRVEAWPG